MEGGWGASQKTRSPKLFFQGMTPLQLQCPEPPTLKAGKSVSFPHTLPQLQVPLIKSRQKLRLGGVINTNLSGGHLHHPTVFPFFFDAEKMLFTAMMTQPEISPFEDIITVRYDTLSAVRRLFAVAIKYSPVTPTHLSHISSLNRLSINIGSGTNGNNEHSQLKKTCTGKSCQRASFPSRKGVSLPWRRLSRTLKPGLLEGSQMLRPMQLLQDPSNAEPMPQNAKDVPDCHLVVQPTWLPSGH